MRILAISGSLRGRSSNTQVLRAVIKLAPPTVNVIMETELDSLPFFNPDLDEEGMMPPPQVRGFRMRIAAADALLICTPEYAHGIPGVLKNALDWLVSGSEIPHKPIGLINASPRSIHAQVSLADTLKTMMARLVPEASITLPLSGRQIDGTGIAADPALAEPLKQALEALVAAASQYGDLRRSLSRPAMLPEEK